MDLHALGQRLASSKAFWGDTEEDIGEDRASERTVIRCHRAGDGQFQVTVSNAVGLVALPELQLVVEPKIPLAHFRYLMMRSRAFPRTDEQTAGGAADRTLWDLVALWFLNALDSVLRKGLLSDYEPCQEELRQARGQVQALPTATAYYKGRLALVCRYDEFEQDTPLNRMLAAATTTVLAAPFLDRDLRVRARISMARMNDVGPLRSTDWRVVLDRRSGYYADALALAHHVLSATGRALYAGSEKAWTFLIRTPELIEAGIREVLSDGLRAVTTVEKRGRQLPPTRLRLNPDLVFGHDLAVGDVKYKLSDGEWSRPDLYQAVAFAAGFDVPAASVIGFRTKDHVDLPPLSIGRLRIRGFLWGACKETTPDDAAQHLVDEVTEWLIQVRDDSSQAGNEVPAGGRTVAG